MSDSVFPSFSDRKECKQETWEMREFMLTAETRECRRWQVETKRLFTVIPQEIAGVEGMWIHQEVGGDELEPEGRLRDLSKLVWDQRFHFLITINPIATARRAGLCRSNWNLCQLSNVTSVPDVVAG